MSSGSYEARASIAVYDVAQATEFDDRTIGFSGVAEGPHDDRRVYPCGGGTLLHVNASSANAGQAPPAFVAPDRAAATTGTVINLTAASVVS